MLPNVCVHTDTHVHIPPTCRYTPKQTCVDMYIYTQHIESPIQSVRIILLYFTTALIIPSPSPSTLGWKSVVIFYINTFKYFTWREDTQGKQQSGKDI